MTDEPENTLVAEPGEVYEELDIKPVRAPITPDWNLLEITELAKAALGPDAPQSELNKWIKGLFAQLSPEQQLALSLKWHFWARRNQIAPEGNWTFWLLLAGRGFGKTRCGAEWINERVQSGLAKRIALVAPTAADVRKVMVEGESGILAISPPWNRPVFEPSKLQLTWPNGAIAGLYSAEEPERLRGPQCDTFWADELAAWKKLQGTWDMLQFGFRLGQDPRGCITTTPKPVPIVKELIADDRGIAEELRSERWNGETAVTRGKTDDNKANLAPKFYSTIVKKYQGTRLGRQELDAEILDDMPGALWTRAWIDAQRRQCNTPPWSDPISGKSYVVETDPGTGQLKLVTEWDVLKRRAQEIVNAVGEDLIRVVVAVDPNASNNEGSDEIGITVDAKGVSGHGYVLADLSMRGSPNEWASVAVLAHDLFLADRVIAEANNGGNMVENTVTSAAKFLKMQGIRPSDNIGVTLVHASRGKVTRAEPVSALYEQNRVSHVGTHKVLEDQMCLFTLDFDRTAMGYSPDRVDSLVWGMTHLFLEEDGTGLLELLSRQSAEAAAKKRNKDDPANLVRLRGPEGVTAAYGGNGDRYSRNEEGFFMVRPEDVKGLRAAQFKET